ncbi:MAG: hypothetical protein GY854_17345 [Deltaproteobacteria bacterium]|nr:hypothetical protein [Deltaproteobacteria bacterium]
MAELSQNSSSDSDADSDADTDADTDADADVYCSSEPSTCEDIGPDEATQYFGCCYNNTVYYCTSGTFGSADCTTESLTCSYSETEDAMWCL